MKIEFMWFDECQNHADARGLLQEVMASRHIQQCIEDIDATDPAAAVRYCFPGSPTIRINGRDVEPGFSDPGDYTPRCRLYATSAGLKGIPDRSWIEDAFASAERSDSGGGCA